MGTLRTLRRILPFAAMGVATTTLTPWVITRNWMGGATGFVLGALASVLVAWQLTPFLEVLDARRGATDS